MEIVDVAGPGGNAFAILGRMAEWGKSKGFDKDKIDEIRKEAMSSNYNNLLDVTEKYFGDVVTFINRR